MDQNYERAVQDVIRMARYAGARDWIPATSGNFSVRLSASECAVTASGGDKAQLTPEGVIRAAIDGPAPAAQSAEAELHYVAYRLSPAIGAVAHVHALSAVLASISYLEAGRVRLIGYELLKAFEGIKTHETVLDIPIFENDQDMARLGTKVTERLTKEGVGYGYLIAGHGLYVWGVDATATLRHLDAMDYLFKLVLKAKGIPA